MYLNQAQAQYQEKERAMVSAGSVVGSQIVNSSLAQELQRLQAAVEKATVISSDFVGRCGPVMRDSLPTAQSDQKESLADTNLGAQMRGMSIRLEAFVDFMGNAHERLAL